MGRARTVGEAWYCLFLPTDAFVQADLCVFIMWLSVVSTEAQPNLLFQNGNLLAHVLEKFRSRSSSSQRLK